MSMQIVTEQRHGPLVYDRGSITGDRLFSIIANSPPDAKNKLLQYEGITIGTAYQDIYGNTPDPNIEALRIVVNAQAHAPIGGTGAYLVQVQYGLDTSNEPYPGGGVKLRINGSLVQVRVDTDSDGDAITNSSDEPFEDAFNADEAEEILEASWIVSLADNTLNEGIFTSGMSTFANVAAAIRPYRGALNNATFEGTEVETVMCTKIDAQPQGANLVRVDATFHKKDLIDPADLGTVYIKTAGTWGTTTNPFSAWHEVVADRGRRVKGSLVGGVQQYTPILDANSKPITDPVALDGLGARLAAASDQVVRVFVTNGKRADFGDLW